MAGFNVRSETTASTSETTTSLQECSICLDTLGDTGRPMTKLRCGHQFHLDCIGSAFNSKHGVMQCPYCRNIEKEGQWHLSPSSSGDSYVIDETELEGDSYGIDQISWPRWPRVAYPWPTHNLNYGDPSTLVDEGDAQASVPHHLHPDASHLIYPGYAYAGASRLIYPGYAYADASHMLFAHVYPDAHQLVPVYVDAGLPSLQPQTLLGEREINGSHYNIEVVIEGEINGSDYNIEVDIEEEEEKEEEITSLVIEEEEQEEEEVSSRYTPYPGFDQ